MDKVKEITPGRLITFKYKYEETLQEISRGEISHKYEEPCTVTYCPEIRKYLIQDGNHRAIEKLQKGHKKIPCKVNPHQPKYYPDQPIVTIQGKDI